MADHSSDTIITGVIGEVVHVIGLRVIENALEDEGYEVVFLDVQTQPVEFFDAAVETGADCIVVSSMSGHAPDLCENFHRKAVDAGLNDFLLYLGG